MEKNNNEQEKWVVYAIAPTNNTEKSRWSRAGVAYVNRDGSFNLYLDSVPIHGKLQIRKRAFQPNNGRSAIKEAA